MEKLYSHTTGWCRECATLTPARIIERQNKIWLETMCPEHGNQAALISSDPKWYQESRNYIKPGAQPLAIAVNEFHGCPDSCGLCPEHRQHTCLPIAEITHECNLACPVCLKEPGETFGLSAAQYQAALRNLKAYEGGVPLINLSGGEPTLHPEFAEILKISEAEGIMQVSVSTNGLTLYNDPKLRKLFKETGAIASLQFDGFRPETWRHLRGADLSALKLDLIRLFEEEGLRYSLTATIMAGLNFDELTAIVDFFFASKALSLMIQPVCFTGRASATMDDKGRLTMPDIVNELYKSRHIKPADFNPLPCSHYSCFVLAYYFCLGDDSFYSLKEFLGKETYINLIANKVLPGLDEAGHNLLKDRIYEFWASPRDEQKNAQILAKIKSILKSISCVPFSPKQAFEIGSGSLKSIFIHHFMDARNFDLARLMKCCNHYVQPDGRLVPMCAHNLPHAAKRAKE